MKSNWTTEELKQALEPEALAKLEQWHENKVREREAARKAKAALRAIPMQKVTEVLGEEAAQKLQAALAQVQTSAATVSTTAQEIVASSAAHVAHTPKHPARRS